MEGGRSNIGNNHIHVSSVVPFVLKTYGMVNDPSTDSMISWGRGNNSFIVVDPFGFSQQLLPSHFKHNNFSSFVRQLNTYGFRKVDPDRWEFAHQSFLRGQTHLLHNIIRRNTTATTFNSNRWVGKKHETEDSAAEADEDERIAVEVARLKEKQKATKAELGRMWTRLQETERKPKQILAFLVKAVQNPHLIPRLRQTSPPPQIKVEEEEQIQQEVEGKDHHHLLGYDYDYDEDDDVMIKNKKKRPLLTISSLPQPPPPPWQSSSSSSPAEWLDTMYETQQPFASSSAAFPASSMPIPTSEMDQIRAELENPWTFLLPEFGGGGGVEMDEAGPFFPLSFPAGGSF